MWPFCSDFSIETVQSKAKNIILVDNVKFKDSFTHKSLTVRLATSSRYANSYHVFLPEFIIITIL